MAESTVFQLASSVNKNELLFIENNGQILLTSEEIGKQLGYAKPAKSVNRLFSRKQKELARYAVGVKLTSTDGKSYERRAFTEEGVYIISMLADTPNAVEFRSRLASLLRQLREQRMELARQSGYEQGLAEGQSFPAIQIATKQAFLSGLTEGRGEADKLRTAPDMLLALKPSHLKILKKVVRYVRMGLTTREINRLTGEHGRRIGSILTLARKAGLLPPSRAMAVTA